MTFAHDTLTYSSTHEIYLIFSRNYEENASEFRFIVMHIA